MCTCFRAVPLPARAAKFPLRASQGQHVARLSAKDRTRGEDASYGKTNFGATDRNDYSGEG